MISHVPAPPLSHFIELMWFGEDYIVPHALERVMPTGSLSLVINLHEDRTRSYDPDDLSKYTAMSGSILVGAYSEFTVIDTAEQRSTMGAVFKPGGAFPFFKLPASELRNREISLHEVLGADAGFLREQLLAAKTPRAKFNVLERTLLGQIKKPLERHAAVQFAVANFKRCPERAVSAVTDQIGLSERRFIKLFDEQVGLTPKLFCRVQRFQKVLRHIARCNVIDWPQIALSCGYFDQAHFNHDFRLFSGINPSLYLVHKTQFQNHVKLQD